MVEAVLEERPLAAARHILGRLNVRPDAKLGELRERLAGLGRDQRDVVVSTRELAMAPVDGALMVGGNERYTLREHAFGQISTKLGIPAHYLRRCDPDLRPQRQSLAARGRPRRDAAFRGRRSPWRALRRVSADQPPGHPGLAGIAPGRDPPVRYELTEGYLDLQVVGPVETGMPEVRRDPLHRGLHLRNSEVGLARVNISALVYRTICLNGQVVR